jgi:hypothetical protein
VREAETGVDAKGINRKKGPQVRRYSTEDSGGPVMAQDR